MMRRTVTQSLEITSKQLLRVRKYIQNNSKIIIRHAILVLGNIQRWQIKSTFLNENILIMMLRRMNWLLLYYINNQYFNWTINKKYNDILFSTCYSFSHNENVIVFKILLEVKKINDIIIGGRVNYKCSSLAIGKEENINR